MTGYFFPSSVSTGPLTSQIVFAFFRLTFRTFRLIERPVQFRVRRSKEIRKQMRFFWYFYRSGSGQAIDTCDKDGRTRKSKWQTGEKYAGIFIAPPCVWLCFPERPLFSPPYGKCAHAQVNENRSTFRRRCTCPNFAAVRPSVRPHSFVGAPLTFSRNLPAPPPCRYELCEKTEYLR